MEEHEVIIILKKIPGRLLECDDKYLEMHLHYYKGLHQQNKMLKYGTVTNDDSICIWLKVSSATDFERIVLDDPALDKLFEIVNVIPFLSKEMSW